MTSEPPLKVCLDMRFPDGPHSGTKEVAINLARAISELEDGNEEYLFLAYRDSHEWLKRYVGGRCRLLLGRHCYSSYQSLRCRSALKRIPGVSQLWHGMGRGTRFSDGTIERAGARVMHFVAQNGFVTEVPSIYQPHDLQHLHYPEYFSRLARAQRERQYRTYCQRAAIVVMMSGWGKTDIIQQYGLPEWKVKVVPGAPSAAAYQTPTPNEAAAARRKYDLPAHFVFYPAETWPHKNHTRLLEALAILRDKNDTKLSLVCSGNRNRFFSAIESNVRHLKLEEQVKFLGFVSPLELQCLYKASLGVIFPSVFEGWGLPVMEAFAAGVPVACSNIRPMREQVSDAAMTFDPLQPEQIAAALLALRNDEATRRALVKRGYERAALFSWDHTAKLFRACYRALGNALTADDRVLLAERQLV